MVSSFKFASGRAGDLFGCLLASFSAVSSVAGANPELVRIRDALDSSPHLINFTAALLTWSQPQTDLLITAELSKESSCCHSNRRNCSYVATMTDELALPPLLGGPKIILGTR